MNRANNPMLSNSHPKAPVNKSRHLFKMGGGCIKPKVAYKNFDMFCSRAPHGRFRKLFFSRDAMNFDYSPNILYLSSIFAGKFTHIISKRTD